MGDKQKCCGKYKKKGKHCGDKESCHKDKTYCKDCTGKKKKKKKKKKK